MTDSTLRKIGWGVSGVLGLAFIASSFFKFFPPPEAVENSTKMGFDPQIFTSLGVLELACAILFLIPKSAFFGAILLTGYMGGAICTHLRVGDPIIIQVLFPILVWIGFGLRNPNKMRTVLAAEKNS
jgi:uncharacterized membrane protein YphA (DoxX/SURF4 family)